MKFGLIQRPKALNLVARSIAPWYTEINYRSLKGCYKIIGIGAEKMEPTPRTAQPIPTLSLTPEGPKKIDVCCCPFVDKIFQTAYCLLLAPKDPAVERGLQRQVNSRF